MRFANDFTRLADYFGPDDYDQNLNTFENLNTIPAKCARPFSELKKDDGNQSEEKTKTNKKCMKLFK